MAANDDGIHWLLFIATNGAHSVCGGDDDGDSGADQMTLERNHRASRSFVAFY